jgi:hypothetical protein
VDRLDVTCAASSWMPRKLPSAMLGIALTTNDLSAWLRRCVN